MEYILIGAVRTATNAASQGISPESATKDKRIPGLSSAPSTKKPDEKGRVLPRASKGLGVKTATVALVIKSWRIKRNITQIRALLITLVRALVLLAKVHRVLRVGSVTRRGSPGESRVGKRRRGEEKGIGDLRSPPANDLEMCYLDVTSGNVYYFMVWVN